MNKKMYILGGSVVLLSVLYYVFSDTVNGWFTNKTSDETEPPTDVIEVSKSLDENKILSLGSKGLEVKELQKILNSMGASLDIDGSFGLKTQASLLKYAKVYKISLKYAREGAKSVRGVTEVSNKDVSQVVEYGATTGIGIGYAIAPKMQPFDNSIVEIPLSSYNDNSVIDAQSSNMNDYSSIPRPLSVAYDVDKRNDGFHQTEKNYYGGEFYGGMTEML